MTQLGLVGCAHIHTPGFVKNINSRPGLKVKNVWDPNPARSSKRGQELNATVVLEIPLTEASAKVRTGGPLDDEEDYALPIWAGVIPFELTPSPPIPDERMTERQEPPAYVRRYRRPHAGDAG